MDAQAELENGEMFYLSFETDRPGAMPRAVICDARDHTVYVRLYEKPTVHTMQVGDREEINWSFGPHAEAVCRVLNKMPAGDVTLASAMDELEIMIGKLAGELAGAVGILRESIAGKGVPLEADQELERLYREMRAFSEGTQGDRK